MNKKWFTIGSTVLLCSLIVILSWNYASKNPETTGRNLATKFLTTLYTSDASRYENALTLSGVGEETLKKADVRQLMAYLSDNQATVNAKELIPSEYRPAYGLIEYIEAYQDSASENLLSRMNRTYQNLFFMVDRFAYHQNYQVAPTSITLDLEKEEEDILSFIYTVTFQVQKHHFQQEYETQGRIETFVGSYADPSVLDITLFHQHLFDHLP